MEFTVFETDRSFKTNGWFLGTVEAATKEEAERLAKERFPAKHKGKVWVQYPSEYLNRNCRLRF